VQLVLWHVRVTTPLESVETLMVPVAPPGKLQVRPLRSATALRPVPQALAALAVRAGLSLLAPQ